MAIFIRKPALSELITLNCCCCCCCLSVLCLLLVLLVEATDEESESDDESDPSSESEEEVEDDDDDSGDLPGGFDSTGGVLLTVVMAAKVGDFPCGIFDHFCLICLVTLFCVTLARGRQTLAQLQVFTDFLNQHSSLIPPPRLLIATIAECIFFTANFHSPEVEHHLSHLQLSSPKIKPNHKNLRNTVLHCPQHELSAENFHFTQQYSDP